MDKGGGASRRRHNLSFTELFTILNKNTGANAIEQLDNHNAQSKRTKLNNPDTEANELSDHNLNVDELQMASTETIAVCTELMDLNDDCYLAIFKHLNLADLASMAELSARFHASIRSVFNRKYNKELLLNSLFENDDEMSSNAFELIIKHFGCAAVKLEISQKALTYQKYPGRGTKAIEFIALHCSRLKKLDLNGFSINLMATTNHRKKVAIFKMMTNIGWLQLTKCQLYNCGMLFELCDGTLEYIRLTDVDMDSQTKMGFIRKYVKLQTLQLIFNRPYLTRIPYMAREALTRLLEFNSSIEKLAVLKPKLHINLLSQICELNLVELQLMLPNKCAMVPFSKMQRLQTLELRGMNQGAIHRFLPVNFVQEMGKCQALVNIIFKESTVPIGYHTALAQAPNLKWLIVGEQKIPIRK